jgi:hypothetical protein
VKLFFLNKETSNYASLQSLDKKLQELIKQINLIKEIS